tara:strand:- start:186 stop:404 length:219 start_codon:yes stop_codon:yes gene_type:complete
MAAIYLAGLITLFLFGAILVILGLATVLTTWNSSLPEIGLGLNEHTMHGILVMILGFVLIGSGVYVARRPKN